MRLHGIPSESMFCRRSTIKEVGDALTNRSVAANQRRRLYRPEDLLSQERSSPEFSMQSTVFWTILTGVLTYIAGQLVLKLVIDPVQEQRRTIGRISHALIEYANVIANPGVPTEERMMQASTTLRSLSAELQTHLYLVPLYTITARVFRLPKNDAIMKATKSLIGLSNSVFQVTSDRTYEYNSKKVEAVCDELEIYYPDDERWPDEAIDSWVGVGGLTPL